MGIEKDGVNAAMELFSSKSKMIEQIRKQTLQLMGVVVQYQDLMMMYACAIKEVKTKFEVLDTEYSVRYRRNPISSIQSRLKSTGSIIEKLGRAELTPTLENVTENIRDVAGIRVICPYVDDIYQIADALIKQDDITLLKRKDYIQNPKPNGYRSLHLVVEVPVFFADKKVGLPVEVQIRTIAMDFWASLEHQMKYKKTVENQEEIVEQLKQCADTINATDEKMLSIRQQLESAEDIPTEEDILMERLRKMDIKIN